MVTAMQLTPTQYQLMNEKRERDRRYREAVRKFEQKSEVVPFLPLRWIVPEWKKQTVHFDAHVNAWRMSLVAKAINRYAAYARTRCPELGITVEELQSQARPHFLALTRQIICFEMMNFPDGKSTTIGVGRYVDKDHSSICNAVKKIDQMGYEQALKIQAAMRDPQDNEKFTATGSERVIARGFTVSEIRKMRELFPTHSNRKIAEIFRVDIDRISSVRRGETYGDVV